MNMHMHMHLDTHTHTHTHTLSLPFLIAKLRLSFILKYHSLSLFPYLAPKRAPHRIVTRAPFVLSTKFKIESDGLPDKEKKGESEREREKEKEKESESSLPFETSEVVFIHYIPSHSRLIVIQRSPQSLPKRKRVLLPLISHTVERWVGDVCPHVSADTGYIGWLACPSCMDVRYVCE